MLKAVNGRCCDQKTEATPALAAAETLPLAYESGSKRLELAGPPMPQSVWKSEDAARSSMEF